MTILLPGVQMQSPGGFNTSIKNSSVTPQSPVAATRTYLAGSALKIPPAGLQVGSRARWRFNATKTAAGTATSTIDVAFGTAGTTADTAVVSFTKPAGTAAIDEAVFEVEVAVKSVSTTGVLVGELVMLHNGNTVGHATVPVVVVLGTSSGFDNSSDTDAFIGLCITTGAADAITIDYVDASLDGLVDGALE